MAPLVPAKMRRDMQIRRMTQRVPSNAQLQEDAGCFEQGHSVNFYGGHRGRFDCRPHSSAKQRHQWALAGPAGRAWWLCRWEPRLHVPAASWETGGERRRWHKSRPLQKLGRSYSWSRLRMQSTLWVNFAKTLYLWYSSFLLLICPFSFSSGGRCIIFQTFSAYEPCIQSVVHYQGDT